MTFNNLETPGLARTPVSKKALAAFFRGKDNCMGFLHQVTPEVVAVHDQHPN